MVESVMGLGASFLFVGILLGIVSLLLGHGLNVVGVLFVIGLTIIVCDAFIQSFDRFYWKVVK